jgi:hypothetical protein
MKHTTIETTYSMHKANDIVSDDITKVYWSYTGFIASMSSRTLL